MSVVDESYKRELAELRFFRDEVLGLFDWSDEEVDMGLDQLNFIRTRLADERKWAKISAKKAAEYEAEKVKLAAYIALQKQSAPEPVKSTKCKGCGVLMVEQTIHCDVCGTFQ